MVHIIYQFCCFFIVIFAISCIESKTVPESPNDSAYCIKNRIGWPPLYFDPGLTPNKIQGK